MDFMTDLNAYLKIGSTQSTEAKHSTNKNAGKDMDMSDYLQLMIATFQNQTIDDTASTSDMVNQMVQMSVIQAITNLNSIVSESSSMTYAASLVGKEVTIGIGTGSEAKEYVGKVTGTGVLDGEQVIFVGDQMFNLSDVIAVGRVPSSTDVTEIGGSGNTEDAEGTGSSEGSDAGSEAQSGVEADGGTGTYYGYSYDEDDYEYVLGEDGAMRIVYKGEDGASSSGAGVTEQMIPGGTAESGSGVTAASGTEPQQDTTQEQSSAGAEAAAAEWLAENG